MNLRSKIILFALSAFLPLSVWAGNDARPDLFSTVPAGDITYTQLKQLADAGLLSPKDLSPSLTRFDVAELILKAESREIVVAQADEIPPPPGDNSTSSSTAPASPSKPSSAAPAGSNDMELPSPGDVIGPNSAAEANAPATVDTGAQEEAARLEAIKSLHSLEDAYQFELKLVKDKVEALRGKVDDADAQQYDLRKRIKGISQFPTIAVYGYGRAWGIVNQVSGPVSGLNYGARSSFGFLDLNPTGTISKEVKWNTIIRLGSDMESNTPGEFILRRVTMDFNPPWFSAKLGDFDESYTPLMMWNRDSLDLAYKPEMMARQDDYEKYESFLNNEPNWPLRGLKVGTDIMWPDSTVLNELKSSFFAHMIRNGFYDSGANGGWYVGPNDFTDWIFGGTVKAQSPKWYIGGVSTQATIDTYGLIYDEPLDTEQPGSPYVAFNPSTWAHQYILGSVKPDLKVGLGGDFYIGGTMEYANSSYQDDKQAPNRVFTDFALLGGPYIQFGNSRITLNYLNVGPYYYSPLAQTRQDVSNPFNNTGAGYLLAPNLFEPFVQNQYFLPNLPRAGGIYGFYNRTLDNTFPYGLATPNRQGFGGEMDIKALEKDSLKVKGAAYFVQEISGNLVVNGSGTGFIPVDSPTGTTIVPIRNFVYVNLGPSINLGPYLTGFNRDLEVGMNVRYENTNSALGSLTSLWLIGGARMEVLSFWQFSAAYSSRTANGVEAGYGGTLWARYPYLYDNSDLGAYTPINVNGQDENLRLSSAFTINRNSTLYLDYSLDLTNMTPTNPLASNATKNFGEVTYEIKF